MKKKILSVILAVTMFTMLMPSTAFAGTAENDMTTDSENYSDAIITENLTNIDRSIEYLTDEKHKKAIPSSLGEEMEIAREETYVSLESVDNDVAIMAADNSGTCGDDLTWTLDDNGVLTISGTGDMEDYSYNSSPFYKNSDIKSIVIEDGVTSIGDYAFYNCTSVTSVTMPDSVTNIGASAFYSCTSLTNVYITDITSWVNTNFGNSTSNPLYYAENLYINNAIATDIEIPYGVTNISDYSFYNYSGLKSIIIPESVTSIGNYAFCMCENLEYIEIPGSVKTIGEGAFCVCSALKSAVINDGVEKIGNYAFEECIDLTNITIPDSVTSLGISVFYYCENLENAVLGSGITSISAYDFYYCSKLSQLETKGEITEIGSSAFFACSNLEEINLNDGITKISDNSFQGCESLVNISIPNSVTSIGSYAFYNCDSLKNIVIPQSVTSIGSNAFSDCDSLISIDVDSDNAYYISYDGILFDIDYTTLCCFPAGKEGECEIFASITNIEDSLSGQYITSINVDSDNEYYSSQDGVLYNKDKTKLIRYPNGGSGIYTVPDTVTEISNGALDGNGLTSITFPNVDAVDIEYYTFAYSTGLLEININSDSELYSTENGILFNKAKTTIVRYPNAKEGAYYVPDSVTTIQTWAFYGCSQLTEVQFTENLTTLGNFAFAWCTALTSIDLPDSITEINSYAFCGCSSLTDITLSNSLTYIDMDVFQQTGISEIIIPDGVTGISIGAFSYCDNLQRVFIPESVTSISSWAFQNDYYITDVYYGGTKDQWNEIYFGSENYYLTNASIHYNAIGTASPQITNASVSSDSTVELELEDVEYDSTLITVFTQNGILTDTQADTISAGDTLKTVEIADGADSVKVFIWDSLEGMKPLCEAKTADIE